MYGEDDVTVSEERVNVDPVADGSAAVGAFCTVYTRFFIQSSGEEGQQAYIPNSKQDPFQKTFIVYNKLCYFTNRALL